MSALPRHEPPRCAEDDSERDEQSRSMFWHWFAIAVLLFCWIAEASMCADRGF
ncbi:MAG TPA: hypothetical protein VFU13_08795 [Steroidobacteraceae bacterium]|nr:hypothetical protein [Steroidobacteraceae bacterium]